jgi:hypothetical protein
MGTAPTPTTCGKCHRVLKNPVSIERGYGPQCYGAVQAKQGPKYNDPADESDYTYHIDRSGDGPVLVITDQDKGRKSVTNNMDAILKRIAADEGAALTMPIVYRDSEGQYDGVHVSDSGAATFRPLVTRERVTNEQDAIQAALRRQRRDAV